MKTKNRSGRRGPAPSPALVCREVIARRVPHAAALLALAALAALAAAMALPSTAHAALFDEVIDLDGWIANNLLKPPLESLLNGAWGLLAGISEQTILTAPFDAMLGSGGYSVFDLANDVNDSLVKPIALSILALAMLVQLIHVAGRADQDAAMPILRDLVMIALFYVCFRWLINNSADLCVAVYTDLNAITAGIASAPSMGDIGIAVADLDGIGEVVSMLFVVLIVFLASLVAAIVTICMAYLRAFQLYVFAAFAPIPLALLGFEQTRQYGIGFIKNFVALVLAGAVMVFLLFCFPLLINTGISTGLFGNNWTASSIGAVTLIAMCLLLIIGMLKSGSIARSILGE